MARSDYSGRAWWHWAIAGAVVAACAVATVATAGGFGLAMAAVASVGSGVAAASTGATIAAGAFIGSSTALGLAATVASASSSSDKEFFAKGNWGTVGATTAGAVVGAAAGLAMVKKAAASQPALSDEHWEKNAESFGTPNSTVNHTKYNSYTGQLETSTVHYDYAGRQSLRIDWTNHGRLDHGNPHVHLYYFGFGPGYEDGWEHVLH